MKQRIVCLAACAATVMVTATAVFSFGFFAQRNLKDSPLTSSLCSGALSLADLPETPICPVLYYGEQRIGRVEEDFDQAEFLTILKGELGESYTPRKEFSLRQERSDETPLNFDRCLRTASNAVQSEYTDARGLYINGTLIAAARDDGTLQEALDAFLDAFAELKESEGQAVLKNSVLGSCTVPEEDLLSCEEIEAVLAVCCSEEKFDFFVKDEKVVTFLENHQVPQLSPVIVEQVSESYEETVPFETVIVEDKSLYVGARVVEAEGHPGTKRVTVLITYEDGQETSREVFLEEILVPPSNEVIREGMLPPGAATGEFIWTTSEGYISSLYGYRDLFGETKLHAGIDIAVPTGTPLYAGDGGTVIHAGDAGNGYGIYVVIDHGNDIVTYYGHMSKVAVKEGDKLCKGDLVGYSGATGRVTGPHVHYEFRVNGKSVNPKKYLSDR